MSNTQPQPANTPISTVVRPAPVAHWRGAVSTNRPAGIRAGSVAHSRLISALWALALAIVFDVIYMATRTEYYSADAVRIAQGIVTFHHTHDLDALFRPGYILFGPFGLSIWHASYLFGYRGGPLVVLQSINCLAGAIGIGLLSILLRQILTRSRTLTVLMPIALGFSFGYWMLATDGRAETVALALTIGAACLLIRVMTIPTPIRAASAGFACGVAILFHLFAILILPAAVVAVILAEYTQGERQLEQAARRKNVGLFLGSALLPVLIIYLWIGLGVLGFHTVHAWSLWIRQGFEADWWIGPHTTADLRLDAYSLRKALFVEPGGKTGTFHLSSSSDSSTLLYWISLLTWFAAVYMIASKTAFMMRTHYSSYLTVALTALATYALVFTYVCPGNFIYWTPVVTWSTIVTSICASYYRGRRGGALWLTGIGCWVIIFGVSNYNQFIAPHEDSANNQWMAEANTLAKHTKRGDLIVVSGFDDDTPIVAYVPFFVHRDVYSLRTSLEEHNGDVVLTSRDLYGAVQAAIQSGHRAYAFANIWSDPDTRIHLTDISGEYNPQQVFAGLQRAQGWSDDGAPGKFVWKLIPTQYVPPSSSRQKIPKT